MPSRPRPSRLAPPVFEDGINRSTNASPRFVAFPASGKQLVVVGFAVANVGAHCEVDGGRIERFGVGAAADATAVFAARVGGDFLLALGRPDEESELLANAQNGLAQREPEADAAPVLVRLLAHRHPQVAHEASTLLRGSGH